MSAIRALTKRERNAWLVSFVAYPFILCGTCAASQSLAQQSVLEYHSENQRYLLPDEEIPRVTPLRKSIDSHKLTAQQLREQQLWKLLNQQRLAELHDALEQLRKEHPEWQVPHRLLEEFERQQQAALIQQRARAKDWPELITLSKQFPRRFSCAEVYHLWLLADAYTALGQAANTKKIYQRIVTRCTSAKARVASLERAASQLEEADFAELMDKELPRSRPKSVNSVFNALRYGFSLRSASSAYDQEAYAHALALLHPLKTQIEASRDAAAASLLAWSLTKRERRAEAVTWFERAVKWSPSSERRYALALAYFQEQRFTQAEVVARQVLGQEPRATPLLKDILVQEAYRAYQQEDYSKVIEKLTQAQSYGELDRQAELLASRSYYQLGDERLAAQKFAELYRQSPDWESARGVVFSYLKLNDLKSAYALSQTVEGPLASLLPRDRFDPLLAKNYTWGSLPLEVAESGALSVDKERLDVSSGMPGAMYRYKSGESGLSRLEIMRFPSLNLRYIADARNEWQLHLDRLSLRSGNADPQSMIGSLVDDATVSSERPTARLDNGYESVLRYRYRGPYSVFGAIGFTPTGGEVASTVQYKAGLSRSEASHGWNLELFRDPVRESLLSYTGLQDPVSGQTWGRVMAWGVKGSVYHALKEDWTLGGSFELARLDGRNTQSNAKAELYASLRRNFKHSGFDTLALGPFALVQGYRENQNHFTLGNGGYYSPQLLTVLGLTGRFQTQQRAPYILRGSGSLGYLLEHQESSAYFPLADDGRRFSGEDQRGINFNLQFEAVRQLGSSGWQAVALLQGQLSPEYNEFTTFLGVRYLLGSRRLALFTDLPSEMIDSLY